MVALNVLYGLIKSIRNEDLVLLLLNPNFVSALEGQIPKKKDDCFSSMKT